MTEVVPAGPRLGNTPHGWSEQATAAATSWEAAGWSRSGQSERFHVILDAVAARPGESLLDYGCGTGAFSALLDPAVEYTGYDWSEGMVARAKRDHPGRRFQTWQPTTPFDVVVAIGPFNLPNRWSKQRTWQALRGLWDRAGRALAVSLYAGDDERCLIYTVEECERFAFGESFYARVDRWRRNDILILLEKSRS